VLSLAKPIAGCEGKKTWFRLSGLKKARH
jgi:hypothetical protein